LKKEIWKGLRNLSYSTSHSQKWLLDPGEKGLAEEVKGVPGYEEI
jgi:hypothetical protein